MKMKIKNETGLTLIEIILYVGIAAAVVTTMTLFTLDIGATRQKTLVAQEVQSNMRTAIEVISQKIRAADGVNIGASTFNSDPGVLSLSMPTPALDPTIIQLDADDGSITITEGGGTPVILTTDEVRVTNFRFTNLAAAAIRGNVRLQMTLEYNNPSNNADFDYSQSTRVSTNVRN